MCGFLDNFFLLSVSAPFSEKKKFGMIMKFMMMKLSPYDDMMTKSMMKLL